MAGIKSPKTTVVYDHEENVDKWLDIYKPSQLCLRCDQIGTLQLDSKILDMNLEPKIETANYFKIQEVFLSGQIQGLISKEFVLGLGRAYNLITGKWCIFPERNEVDKVWRMIVYSMITKGGIGAVAYSATVSTQLPNHDNPVICIHTNDFDDEDHVRFVQHKVRVAGVYHDMYYKPTVYTVCGIEYGNEFGIDSLYNTDFQ